MPDTFNGLATSQTVGRRVSTGPMATPSNPEVDIEYGVQSLLPFGAWSSTYAGGTEGSVLIGNDPRAVPLDNLVEMRKHDGQARALIRLITLPLLAAMKEAKWTESGSAGEGAEEAQFANDMFDLPPSKGGMTVPKHKLLKQTLMALTDGFAVFEEVRQVPVEGNLAGKVTLRKLAYRDPRTIQFLVDKTGGFLGVHQIASMPGGTTVNVDILKDKVIYFAASEEENPYYGVSMLESAYYHYEIKKKLYYIAHIAAQFAAVPGRIGKMDVAGKSPREIQKVKDMLASFAFNTSGILPQGWEVQLINNNTQFDFLKLIDHHNTMMAASVLAKFLQQEDRQVLIDNGKADASADMFVLALSTVMNEIAEMWSTYLMPKYIDWNFGTQNYPVYKFGPLTDQARESIKELFETVVIAGTLNCTPEFVRQLEEKLSASLGLDIDYAEIAQAEEEQAKSDAEAQAQEQQMQVDQQAAQAQQAAAQASLPSKTPGTPPASQSSNSNQTIKASQFGLEGDMFDQVIAAVAQRVAEDEADQPVQEELFSL